MRHTHGCWLRRRGHFRTKDRRWDPLDRVLWMRRHMKEHPAYAWMFGAIQKIIDTPLGVEP